MPRWLFILLLLLSQQSLATTPTIGDFAYRAELTSAQQRLQRVELPIEVLLDLTAGNLADIAIFDANGKTLPHSVQPALQRKIEGQIDLKFHVFDSFRKQNSRIVTTREQTREEGQLSEVQTTETIETQQLRQDYLIELPEDSIVTELELQWHQEPKNQVLQVRVEVGDDLDNMRTIEENKMLSNTNTNAPEWRFIGKIPGGQKYLRIKAVDNIHRFELKKAIGHYQQNEPEPRLWNPVEASAVIVDDKTYLGFDSPSKVTANAMRIIPTESHHVITGSLYAGNSDFENKRRIVSGFSQHNIQGEAVKPSRPIALPNRRYQHWWVSLEQQQDILPSVEMAYPVYEVIFLGNGNQPFTIAWGNYQIQGQTGDLSKLMNSDFSHTEQRGTVVKIKTIELSGGVSRLSPEAEYPWKTWLLWTFLVLAVLVTGRMAYALYRDMNR